MNYFVIIKRAIRAVNGTRKFYDGVCLFGKSRMILVECLNEKREYS